MAMDELRDRMDLSALDPFVDPAHGDALVARVLESSAFELARRRRSAVETSGSAGAAVLAIMAGWAKPALAAAALAVVVSGLALRAASPEVRAEAGVLEAMALPGQVEEWLVEERSPTTADLILTLEGGTAW